MSAGVQGLQKLFDRHPQLSCSGPELSCSSGTQLIRASILPLSIVPIMSAAGLLRRVEFKRSGASSSASSAPQCLSFSNAAGPCALNPTALHRSHHVCSGCAQDRGIYEVRSFSISVLSSLSQHQLSTSSPIRQPVLLRRCFFHSFRLVLMSTLARTSSQT